MVRAVVDTSEAFAHLDVDDLRHADALRARFRGPSRPSLRREPPLIDPCRKTDAETGGSGWPDVVAASVAREVGTERGRRPLTPRSCRLTLD